MVTGAGEPPEADSNNFIGLAKSGLGLISRYWLDPTDPLAGCLIIK